MLRCAMYYTVVSRYLHRVLNRYYFVNYHTVKQCKTDREHRRRMKREWKLKLKLKRVNIISDWEPNEKTKNKQTKTRENYTGRLNSQVKQVTPRRHSDWDCAVCCRTCLTTYFAHLVALAHCEFSSPWSLARSLVHHPCVLACACACNFVYGHFKHFVLKSLYQIWCMSCLPLPPPPPPQPLI